VDESFLHPRVRIVVMIRTTVSIILFAAFAGAASAQPEVMAWGNLTGLRVEATSWNSVPACASPSPNWWR
jgi:hypothetical protein